MVGWGKISPLHFNGGNMAVRRICPICNGAATDAYCEFTGYKYYGNMEDIFGLFFTHEIYDACDPEDIEDLDGQQTEEFDRILSMGNVCLYAGTRVRSTLESFFPEGTVTRTNLDLLVSNIEDPVTPEP
jgi:hypothetical protein